MSVILITGAATGIGNLTARALAADGHTVYASTRDPGCRNAAHATDLLDTAKNDGTDLRVIELDVQSEDSARQAVATTTGEANGTDVVVHNAGHLYLGCYPRRSPPKTSGLAVRRQRARHAPR